MIAKRKPKEYDRTKKLKSENLISVKCCGPLLPEHVFLSYDRKRNRICDRCKASEAFQEDYL